MYRLEPYHGINSRHTCPYCGAPHQFAYYVNEDGKALNEYVGRCNRETNCGKHYKPTDFFRDHPDFTIKEEWMHQAPKVERRLCFIDRHHVTRYRSDNSVLINFLRRVFDIEDVERACRNYRIGATADGRTVFWQIDHEGRVRSGKVMEYGTDGHRIKKEQDCITWMHTILKKDGYLPTDWQLTQCLFGEHLLKSRPEAQVCIVESEKTALIASIYDRSKVWLATGGKNNLNGERIAPLQGRKVVIFPDADAVDKWKEFAANAERFYDITVADLKWTAEDAQQHKDIGDTILSQYGI